MPKHQRTNFPRFVSYFLTFSLFSQNYVSVFVRINFLCCCSLISFPEKMLLEVSTREFIRISKISSLVHSEWTRFVPLEGNGEVLEKFREVLEKYGKNAIDTMPILEYEVDVLVKHN